MHVKPLEPCLARLMCLEHLITTMTIAVISPYNCPVKDGAVTPVSPVRQWNHRECKCLTPSQHRGSEVPGQGWDELVSSGLVNFCFCH